MYKFAITRPVTTFMFALSLMFFGVLALNKIPKALFPDIDFPVVMIKTTYPGASAETIETKVTDRIEQAVMGIDGVKYVISNSARNVSIVTITFELEKPIEIAANDVRDKVSSVLLDSDVDKPVVQKVDTGGTPIISVFLASNEHSAPTMMKHANNIIAPMLQRISGVGNVLLNGYRARQIKIYPDPSLMNKYGLTFSEVASLVQSENLEVDGGRILTNKNDFSVITDANGYSVEDIGNIRIKDGLRLSDIALIEDGLQEEKTYASFKDQGGKSVPGVIFEVQKITGANEIDIAKGVMDVLPSIQAVSPGYEVRAFRDTTSYIKSSIKDIEFDLALGAVLAVLVVFLFLRSGRITLVSAISIPVSVFATFALVSAVGFTLNLLTLTALTISIGIIIDDAIVVIENIHKKLESGMSKREASYEGVKEIGFALIAISAMLLSVFIPVGTMSGISGRFLASFGLTVALAIIVSYIVVITIIPMFSSILLTPKQSRFYHATEPFFKGLENSYLKIVGFIMKSWVHMLAVVVIVFGIFVASIFVARTLGNEFILKEDRDQFGIFIKAKPGISITEMKRKVALFRDHVMRNKNVEFATVQVGPGNIQSVYAGAIYVLLKPMKERLKQGKDQGQFELMYSIGKELRGLEEAKGIDVFPFEIPLVGGGRDNTPFQVAVFAPTDDLLKKSVEDVSNFIKTNPQWNPKDGGSKINNFHLSTSDYQPEYRIHVLKQNLAKYGISASAIGSVINRAFSGETRIAYFKELGKEYDITIRVPDNKRISVNDIKRLQVRDAKGNLIFIEGLINIEKSTTAANINRFNRQRSITVAVNPINGLSVGELVLEVEKNALNGAKWLAPGSGYRFLGEADNQAETQQAFGVAIAMAFVLIYLILAGLYESFLQPIIIMVTMPLSFSGAFFAIKLSGMPMSMFSTIALIFLIGLVGKNATLLVDVANEQRKQGRSIIQSIMLAGELRLRPILMTTIAMVAGMIPLAIASGDGSAIKQPIGVAMIGGLLVSMILSLLVIPVFYSIITPIDEKLQRFYKPKSGDKF